MKTKLMLAALFLIATTSVVAEQKGTCAALRLGSAQKGEGRFDSTFSATQVIDLDVSVLFTKEAERRYTGTHVLEVRFYTPKGYLYQSMAIPFSADPGAKGKNVLVPGYPRAIEAQVLGAVTYLNGQHLRALVRLPVAGTPIVTNSLYGSWSVKAFVDGETQPCSNAAAFTITQ